MLLRNKLLLLSQGYITCSKPYGSLWTVIKTAFWPQDIVVYSRKKTSILFLVVTCLLETRPVDQLFD